MTESRRIEPEILSPAADGATRSPGDLPHPLDGKWYINVQDKTHGPYTGHNLKGYMEDGRMTGETMVLRLGSSDWTKAVDDPVLCSYVAIHRPPAVRTGQAVQSPVSGKVSAAEGATVVQVTNHITAPSPIPSVILDGEVGPKSAGLALVLSILIVGLGQCYNGQIGKGILMFVLSVALWFVLLGWIIMIWSAVDAYQTAKAKNLTYMRLLAGGNVPVMP